MSFGEQAPTQSLLKGLVEVVVLRQLEVGVVVVVVVVVVLLRQLEAEVGAGSATRAHC